MVRIESLATPAPFAKMNGLGNEIIVADLRGRADRVTAVASLLGFPMLAGAAATGARFLIGVVLVLFLLVLFGLIAIT